MDWSALRGLEDDCRAERILKLNPWMGFSGEAGSIEYAQQVFDWLESEFGAGTHQLVCQDGSWYVDEVTKTPPQSPN